MSLLATASEARLTSLWDAAALSVAYEWVRRPERGSVMAQGRMGGVGAAFNLGDVAVTRCALRLSGGEIGHGYVQGAAPRKAEIAALCDALMQTDKAGRVRDAVLEPLREARDASRRDRAARAAATRVEFFTVARGED
jgi:alpha-D-ribose 1-methylphosphonate 5-triphosphate synthase subunit PhnG